MADDNGDKNSVELEKGLVDVMVDGADVLIEPEESDALKCNELGDGLMVDSWCAADKYCVGSVPSCWGKV